MQKPKLRVIVIDDSSICRASIAAILEAEGDIEVVGEGEDGFAALPLIETLAPDLVTMDIQMPGKGGIETVEHILARKPVPILIITAQPLGDDAGVAFQAIESGALEILPKPSMTDDVACQELRNVVRSLVGTPVFRRPNMKPSSTMPAASAATEVIAIVTGIGAMASVLGLLARLPGPLRCPMILYHPVAQELVAGYARYVDRLANQPVVLASPPFAQLRPSQCLLVPGLRSRCVTRGELVIEEGLGGADELLTSLANVYGAKATGVVLAGRDDEGVEGLLALRRAMGITFTERSTADNGNEGPAAVIAADAAEFVMPLSELADRLYVLGGV
jgi:two-component system chemotaxis response regulator CheB